MKVYNYIFVFVIVFLTACSSSEDKKVIRKFKKVVDSPITKTSLVILGNVQDAGSPHPGCSKKCCANLFKNEDHTRKVVCLGLIDPVNKKKYLFEATPDLPWQMKRLKELSPFATKETPDGIFLTHAHIGHYSGLMYLGKEGLNTDSVPVYAMPRMKEFLEKNGPWSQLVGKKNIAIRLLSIVRRSVELSSNINVTPIKVPHRDEFSETVGFFIKGPAKTVLFIPDIDKWSKWVLNISDEIKHVDYVFIDGTFYNGEEINTRNIAEIPHPFVTESMELFKDLPLEERKKIYFIHFNHTNALLGPNSEETKTVLKNGFNIARMNDRFEL